MAVYSYIVIDKQGKEKKGSMEAETIAEVKSFLRLEGNIPIYVAEQSVLNKDINITFGKPVKTRELSIFCRQFGSLLSAGVTIIQALSMLSRHTENKHLSKVIKKVQLSVEKGETLADSLKEYDKIFPSFMISMIEAGEASGKLETALIRLSVQFEKDAAMKSQVKKAMIYPIALILVMIGVIIVMMIYVIPRFTEMFVGMDTELPAMTQLVINISNFISKWWLLMIGLLMAAVVILRLFKNTPYGKVFFGRLTLVMPLFGKLTIKSSASRFARTIGTLISTGIPIMDSLDITARTMNNEIVRQSLLDAKEEVSKGIPLSVPIDGSKVFPSMVGDMISIGEETGDLDGMLNKLADYYEEEVKIATESMLAVMQPIIIIVMACIVGVLVAAMLSPIIKMYQMLDQV